MVQAGSADQSAGVSRSKNENNRMNVQQAEYEPQKAADH